MSKKVFSFILAICMLLSMVPASFAETEVHTHVYTDRYTQVTEDGKEYHIAFCACGEAEAKEECSYKLTTDGSGMVYCECGREREHNHEAANNFVLESNEDSTHNVICNSCKMTVEEAVPCEYTDGVCECEYACNHEDYEPIWDNSSKHCHKKLCGNCEYVLEDVKRCFYTDDEGNKVQIKDSVLNGTCATLTCEVCGNEYKGRGTCVADTSTSERVSIGDKHCYPCEVCGNAVPEAGEFNHGCEHDEGEYVCVYCGEVCYHAEDCTGEEYDIAYRDAETHKVSCSCGLIFYEGHYEAEGATCVEGAKCECGAIVGNPNPDAHHCELAKIDGVYYWDCQFCDFIVESDCQHKNTVTEIFGWPAVCAPDEADEVDGQKDKIVCKDCGAVLQDADHIEAEHDWNEWVVTLKPTCGYDGVRERTCKVCDKLETEEVSRNNNADAHGELEFVRHITAATCEDTGLDEYECELCGDKLQLEVKKLSHKTGSIVFGLLEEVASIEDIDLGVTQWTRDPSKFDCTFGIYTFKGCTNCWYAAYDDEGEAVEDTLTYCDYVVEDSLKKVTKYAQHDLEKGKAVKATCTQYAGYIYECDNAYCAYSEIQDGNGNVITATPNEYHIGVAVKNELTADTCAAKGTYKLICSECGAQVAKKTLEDGSEVYVTSSKIYEVDDVKHSNPKTDIADDQALADFDEWVYVEATCTSEGYFKSYCDICGKNYTEVVVTDKANHRYSEINFIGTVVCEEPAKAVMSCEWCGLREMDDEGKEIVVDIEAERVPHNWEIKGTPVKAPTCNEGGEGWIYCTRCGAEEYVVGEEAMEATGDHKYEYFYKVATCTEPAQYGWYCVYCGEPKNVEDHEEEGLGHNPVATGKTMKYCGSNYVLFEYECTRCGELTYRQNNNPDDVLSIGDIDKHHVDNHLFDDKVIQEKTCTKDGFYKTEYCEECGFFGLESVTRWEKAGHVYEGDKPVVVYCTGIYNAYTCQDEDCEEEVLELIEANIDFRMDHGPDNKWLKYDTTNGKAPTCYTEGYGIAYCPECGWKADVATTIEPAHTMTGKKVVVDATCSVDGFGYKYCAVCGYEDMGDTYDIPATETCEFVKYVKYSNSCELENYVVYECKYCGGCADPDELEEIGYTGYIGGDAGVDFEYIDEYGELHNEKLYTAIEEFENKYDGHVWGDEEYREATCLLNAGYRHTCLICGVEEEVRFEEYTATGHDFIVTIVKPTCYVDGSFTKTCYNCGFSVTEPLYSIGHYTYDLIVNENNDLVDVDFEYAIAADEDDPRTIASTCSTKGSTVYTCSECAYTYIQVEDYDYNNHEWVDVVLHSAPTCTKTGLALQKCAKCDVTPEIRVLPAAHNWDEGTVTVPATCTEEGTKVYKCTVEGCKGTKEETLPRTAHNIITTEREADCENAAGIVTKCADCDFEYDFIRTGAAALGHIWSSKSFVPATCTKLGGYEYKCLREGCGEVHFEADEAFEELRHPGKTFIKTVDATCIKTSYNVYNCPLCGIVEEYFGYVDGNAHKWVITNEYNGDVTCANPGYVDLKCELCHVTAPKQYHTPACQMSDYIYSEDVIYRFCLVCGKVETRWVAESFTGFDGCTTISWEYDEVAGKVVKTMVGAHKDLYIIKGYDATCEAAGHTDHIECKACGLVIELGVEIPAHKVEEVPAVAVTCTTDGATAGKYCTVCKKYVVEPQTIKSEGHKEVPMADVAPTVTAPGSKGGVKCDVCQEVLVQPEVLPQLSGMIDRLCTLRKLAADFRDNPESTVIAMLDTTDVITITGELVNEYYPVSSAYGDGFIHMNYLKVA